MLPGLSAPHRGYPQPALLDRTAGTNIGDMTVSGGLAAAFDGTTNQAKASSAQKSNGAGYCGKDWGATSYVYTMAVVYPTNDLGFTNNSTVTVTMYGSNSSPASGTDGTSLGSTGSIADTTSAQTINITNTNAYRYVWVYVDGTGASDTYFAELQLTGY